MARADHPRGTCGPFCPYCSLGLPRNCERCGIPNWPMEAVGDWVIVVSLELEERPRTVCIPCEALLTGEALVSSRHGVMASATVAGL